MTRSESPRPATRRLAIAVALSSAALVVLGMMGGAGGVRAAAPSTAPSGGPHGDTNIEVWFDEPLPPDVPAGRMVPLGFTIWDRSQKQMSQIGQMEVRVHPAAGKATPTQAHASPDWPGHLTTTITIPKGGLGVIDVGLLAEVCEGDAPCVRTFLAMTIGGIGPPPDAKLSELVNAMIHLPRGPYLAGEPIDLDVALERRAAWDPAAVPFPAQLLAIASTPRGSDLATANLLAKGSAEGHYEGTITIPDAGDVSLVLAAPAERGADDVFDGARLQVKVVARAGGGAASGVPTPSPSGTSLPILPIVALVSILVASLVIKRVFADL